MDRAELRDKWEQEKEHYRTQEVGSGVQGFIENILESPEVFGLEHGLKSTSTEDRSYEFLREEPTKQQRQADFVIFISPHVVIPLEAERYEDIESGLGQIFQYQADLEKRLGILTDGWEWRFYNNNGYRKFTLWDILGDLETFRTFWDDYTRLDSYYLSLFEPLDKDSFFPHYEHLPVDSYRKAFFKDITTLIQGFRTKLHLEGYLDHVDEATRGKLSTEITYAYIIQFILFKTLVDNEFEDFRSQFDQAVDAIHDYLEEGQYKPILGIIDGFSANISEYVYTPFSKEQEHIESKIRELFHAIENSLQDISPWLDILVFIRKYNFSDVQNEIFGYVYENYLKELYADREKGQYFTDPDVVNFMLDELGCETEEIQGRYAEDRNSISLVDPACGSGTFLYSAVDRISRALGNGDPDTVSEVEDAVIRNVFGLDVEEFPLYLAEMSIIMRLLPRIFNPHRNTPLDQKLRVFLTKDSIAEFQDTDLKNTSYDEATREGQQGLDLASLDLELDYDSYVREIEDLIHMKQSLEEHKNRSRFRFDYVVANPPYISYNQASRQGIKIFDLMRENLVKLNNIYGVNLHSVPDNPKRYRPNPNFYAFFIALGIALLKDQGRLCFIVPQTLLTAGDLDVIRYHISRHTTLEKIITFPNRLFRGRGLQQSTDIWTSSLVFVLSKGEHPQGHSVEIVRHTNTEEANIPIILNAIGNRDPENTDTKHVNQEKLLRNYLNWSFIRFSRHFIEFYDDYCSSGEGIGIYSEHVIARSRFGCQFVFDSGYSIDESKMLDEDPGDSYAYPRLSRNYFTIRESRGYWPKDDESNYPIKLRQANQQFKLLESRYKIIWQYENPWRFHFTDKDVIWPRNQYCAIGSSNRSEILYLLALLNAPTNWELLTALMRSEGERSLSISTSAVKNFIQVPAIDDDNQHVKDKIIEKADKMIGGESKTLEDCVDFSNTLMQKLDSVMVENDQLVVGRNETEARLDITDSLSIVADVVDNLSENPSLRMGNEPIHVSDLKSIPVVDDHAQHALKSHIDDMVFALYFGIYLDDDDLNSPERVHKKCRSHPHYGLLHDGDGEDG